MKDCQILEQRAQQIRIQKKGKTEQIIESSENLSKDKEQKSKPTEERFYMPPGKMELSPKNLPSVDTKNLGSQEHPSLQTFVTQDVWKLNPSVRTITLTKNANYTCKLHTKETEYGIRGILRSKMGLLRKIIK